MFVTLNLNLLENNGCAKKSESSCPALKYLDSKQDVLIPFSNESKIIGVDEFKELDICKSYVLNTNTEDIANKFFEVYKEVKAICAECWGSKIK